MKDEGNHGPIRPVRHRSSLFACVAAIILVDELGHHHVLPNNSFLPFIGAGLGFLAYLGSHFLWVVRSRRLSDDG